MENIFVETAKRVEDIQKRLQKNLNTNRQLLINFNSNFENNLLYLKAKLPSLYNKVITQKFNQKQVVCFDNGEANLLDVKTGSLLYGDFPIKQTRNQVSNWINGKNVFIKSIKNENNGILSDRYCQLHFYTQSAIEKEIEEFESTHYNDKKINAHEVIQEQPLLVINGGGLGYPLLELCARIEPSFIFYIEPDIETFLCALGVINWIEILEFFESNDQQIFFIIGENAVDSFRIYYDIIWRQYPFLQSYQLFFTHYDSKDTNEFLELAKSNISIGFDSNGMFDDALFGINNIIHNSKKYNYLINAKTNKFQDIPVAIIANGPSLDNDLKYLSEHKENFITVACGTAITALDKINLIPDFYVALERLDDVYKSLLYVKNEEIFKKTINISVDVVHPLTMQKFSNAFIVLKPGENILEFLENDSKNSDFLHKDLLICKNTNPLVANCAISIFLNLHFSNYYLFGVDNGSCNKNKNHSAKSYYNDLKGYASNNILNILDGDTVKGNFDTRIYTNALFNQCRKNIETEINTHHATVYNCSNGAYIKGTIPKHSYEIDLNINQTESKLKFKECLFKHNSQKINIEQPSIDHMLDTTLFNRTIDEIKSIWEENIQTKSRLAIIRNMKKTINLLQQPNLTFIHSVLKGSLCVYFSLIIYSLYIFKSETLSLQISEKCIRRLLEFLILSKEIYAHADLMVQGQHFKIMPQKVYEYWNENVNNKITIDMP